MSIQKPRGYRSVAIESLEGRRLFSVAADVLGAAGPDLTADAQPAVVAPAFTLPSVPSVLGTYDGSFTLSGVPGFPAGSFHVQITQQTDKHFEGTVTVTAQGHTAPSFSVVGKTNRHGLFRFHAPANTADVVYKVHARLDATGTSASGSFSLSGSQFGNISGTFGLSKTSNT